MKNTTLQAQIKGLTLLIEEQRETLGILLAQVLLLNAEVGALISVHRQGKKVAGISGVLAQEQLQRVAGSMRHGKLQATLENFLRERGISLPPPLQSGGHETGN